MPFSESRGFEPKSPKELRDQFRAVNNVVTGGEKESSLIPPSVKEKDVLNHAEVHFIPV
jgi:hypothetical protein